MTALCVFSFKMQLEYHIFNVNTGTKARRHVGQAKEMFLLKHQKAKMTNFSHYTKRKSPRMVICGWVIAGLAS